ncbi:EamA family transporter [Paenibacillus sp. TRM 82003]|nr:EamA family transporter [Paenibacillus sp. TRM 82003]
MSESIGLRFRHAGKALMLVSAWLSATGQLLWKLGEMNLLYLALGGLCYIAGGALMIQAFRLEKLSVAYPLLCVGYVIALLYGDWFLGEVITWKKGLAIALMTAGVSMVSYER